MIEISFLHGKVRIIFETSLILSMSLDASEMYIGIKLFTTVERQIVETNKWDVEKLQEQVRKCVLLLFY